MARILIVDDDPALLRLLSLRLRHEGHDVIEADSGEAALAQLDIELPQLVLSDVRLPGRDGLALFDEIRARHPLAAGDPAHGPRHHPRRGGSHRARRVHLPDQAL
jgi:CheY-like chemotaxis protein